MALHTVAKVIGDVVKTVDDWILLPKRLVVNASPSHIERHDVTPTWGGRGRVSGTVKIGSTLVARRVRLTEAKTGVLIREQWSAADGTYRFDRLRLDLLYTVSAHDFDGGYNDVIAANVTAVL